MRIGFFGDSYLDLCLKHKITPRYWKPWTRRLVEDYDYECVNSGLSGSNQFHAINQWLKFIQKKENLDFAVFSFTWHDRLYSKYDLNQEIFSAVAEKRDLTDIIQLANTWEGVPVKFPEKIKLATELYYDHLYADDQALFNFELQVNYILDLPQQYPNINFIFVPNTELSRQLVLKKFTKGCLINFSFETLSNIESGSPGTMPLNCGRICHLNDNNHELLKEEFYNIITNYKKYQNTIYGFDYNKFDIST